MSEGAERIGIPDESEGVMGELMAESWWDRGWRATREGAKPRAQLLATILAGVALLYGAVELLVHPVAAAAAAQVSSNHGVDGNVFVPTMLIASLLIGLSQGQLETIRATKALRAARAAGETLRENAILLGVWAKAALWTMAFGIGEGLSLAIGSALVKTGYEKPATGFLIAGVFAAIAFLIGTLYESVSMLAREAVPEDALSRKLNQWVDSQLERRIPHGWGQPKARTSWLWSKRFGQVARGLAGLAVGTLIVRGVGPGALFELADTALDLELLGLSVALGGGVGLGIGVAGGYSPEWRSGRLGLATGLATGLALENGLVLRIWPAVAGAVVAVPLLFAGGVLRGAVIEPPLYELQQMWRRYWRSLAAPVLGVTLGYLCIVVVFAGWYWAAARPDGGGFGQPSCQALTADGEAGSADSVRGRPPFSDVLHFSMMTVLTLSYTPLQPCTAATRGLVWAESLLGQGWMVWVVAVALKSLDQPGTPEQESGHHGAAENGSLNPDLQKAHLADGISELDDDLQAVLKALQQEQQWRRERAQMAWWRRPFAP